MKINVNTREINQLVREEGPGAVAAALGISKRQGEQVATQAARAVAEGRELPPDTIPNGTVARSKAMHPARIGHAFSDTEVREMADKIIPPALVGLSAEEYYEHQRKEQEQARRERNRENGHPEFDPRLAEHVRSSSR